MRTRLTIIIFLTLLIVIFGLLAWRLFYVQFYLADDLGQNSERQQHAVITQKPQRGVIVDSRGRILAASNRIDTVFAEPRAIDDIRETANQLQQILDFPGHRICKIIDESKNPGYVRIKTRITPKQRDMIKKARIPGIGIHADWHRFYPTGPLTCHILGFIGFEQNGLAGIELKYDSQLRGSQGRNTLFVDASRKPIGFSVPGSFVNDGLGLVLTIDTAIQQFARTALMKQYKAYNAESAVAVVMDPATGAILAMLSLPDFDPDNISVLTERTLKNRVVTDPFEPGSIFKPIVAALALDAGIVDYNEEIFCEYGDYRGKGFGKIGEFAGHRFGNLTVRQILVQSSNIGMAKIGQKMGEQRLYDGLKLFGFGARTGIDLPGEDAGIVYPVEKWTGYSTTRIPFGHEIMVTSLQIIRAYAALANGGQMVTPHLVRAIVDDNGRITELKQHQKFTGYVVKPEVANWIIRDALVGVVDVGTGRKAALKKWQVFGKTGTANIADKELKGYDETNYIASFVGGAPAENPKVLVLVSIFKPDTTLGAGYSGGRVAAPVVKEILGKTLNYIEQD